jgi:methionyl aminopeptidase
MVSIKSKREIELMRKAGEINALAHKAIAEAIKPGISTLELDLIAERVITSNGATPSFKGYQGYKHTICASINEVVIHGIPNRKHILKKGDIIAIDIGTCYKGYHGDSAMTHSVGEINEDKAKLLEVTERSLYEGLKYAKAGNHLSDISHAIEKFVKRYGYGIVQEFTGHGIGQSLHEEPSIPNHGKAGEGVILKEGMTLAIEPMINLGTERVKILKDGWTVVTIDKKPSAHFEHTVVITKEGYEILTKLEEDDV